MALVFVEIHGGTRLLKDQDTPGPGVFEVRERKGLIKKIKEIKGGLGWGEGRGGERRGSLLFYVACGNGSQKFLAFEVLRNGVSPIREFCRHY